MSQIIHKAQIRSLLLLLLLLLLFCYHLYAEYLQLYT